VLVFGAAGECNVGFEIQEKICLGAHCQKHGGTILGIVSPVDAKIVLHGAAVENERRQSPLRAVMQCVFVNVIYI
jgi:hypothetical protein